ncbi:NAD(P)-binding protein [Daldinia caldariorum]|uniref:NAD(P)-binding protein n=1 Tax=Daldinia caldariorum TaxID=326644 RepID=UPI002007E70E|nr:NAD(P)-binding protein [Daldinia caldariorum]KAI1464866.1 NAD(P)-binding protein [Daldinia caldariorum]
MARKNHTFYFAERPVGEIVPGRTFNYVEADAPTAEELKDGQVLVETLYLSLDPAMRGWLQEFRSYMPPVAIGDRMRGDIVGRVLASKSSKAKEGDLVYSFAGWTEMLILDESNINVLKLPPGAKPTHALGVLGLTGLTAYFGLSKIGQPKPGDTVVVSGAAGAVGSVAGQLARIMGAKHIVGIAGSEEKCKLLTEELGFDAAINYKSPTFREDFSKAVPDYINVFFDNVGGEVLETALHLAAPFSRFVMCGSISGYNKFAEGTDGIPEIAGVRNLYRVITHRVRMEGFIFTDFLQEVPEARAQLAQWLAEGEIKAKETIVKGGLKVADTAINQLFTGGNTGKLIVEVKPYEEVSNSSVINQCFQ